MKKHLTVVAFALYALVVHVPASLWIWSAGAEMCSEPSDASVVLGLATLAVPFLLTYAAFRVGIRLFTTRHKQ